MTPQHPHQQQQQQSSQYSYHLQSQSSQLMPPPSRQSSPAIHLQHQQPSNASLYPTSSSRALYTSDALLAFSPPPAPNPYSSHALQGIVSQSVTGRSSAVPRYTTPAPAASPSIGYPAASTNGAPAISGQAQPGVSSRIVNSLQSLISLLEKQNTKLDKHDERLKTLSESLNLVRVETGRCNESIESFGKTMSKKWKTMTDTASKTLQEDIAASLEKDLAKLRKETSELGKISKQFESDDSASKLSHIANTQTQLLQALTANQEQISEQADSVVERISDAQLDLLHRLSDQFRLVTASINTAAITTRQIIEQSTSRQDQTYIQQIQQFLDLLQSVSARHSSLSAPMSTRIPEETFVMPTPPASQLIRSMERYLSARASLLPALTHRCEAADCTSCLIQQSSLTTPPLEVRAEQADVVSGEQSGGFRLVDEGFHTSSQLPPSSQTQLSTVPNPVTIRSLQDEGSRKLSADKQASPDGRRTSESVGQPASSHRRKPLGVLQPFIMKKRKIIQSDDEEVELEEDAEHEPVHHLDPCNPSIKPFVSTAANCHGPSFDRVQAWRTSVVTVSQAVQSVHPELATTQSFSGVQSLIVVHDPATTEEMSPEDRQNKKSKLSVRRRDK